MGTVKEYFSKKGLLIFKGANNKELAGDFNNFVSGIVENLNISSQDVSVDITDLILIAIKKHESYPSILKIKK